ncbi:unnamed protein product [Candida verbasci]|uniref:Cyclin N-terminal domain-containing protein n=1 Tax=Candida verbasci TaxID=1227364 RepID=A0A9W4TVN1_9ASCO|nr:unnamed protein product [Candida verbasci]
MSDREALKLFSRQAVSQDMINFLVATTNSIIQVKPRSIERAGNYNSNTSTTKILSINPTISLTQFIKNLIKYSNVQTPTLMATLIYLNKLRNLLPANAVGMETTRHRIFLSALIVAAKSLNDSSPLNKHWTKYTDGLLSLQEINLAETELINLLNWNITIKEQDLILTLQPFLIGIKTNLLQKQELDSLTRINYYKLSSKKSFSTYSLAGSSSYQSINSNLSLSQSISSNSLYDEDPPKSASSTSISKRIPLSNKSNISSVEPIKKKKSMMNLLSSSTRILA